MQRVRRQVGDWIRREGPSDGGADRDVDDLFGEAED